MRRRYVYLYKFQLKVKFLYEDILRIVLFIKPSDKASFELLIELDCIRSSCVRVSVPYALW